MANTVEIPNLWKMLHIVCSNDPTMGFSYSVIYLTSDFVFEVFESLCTYEFYFLNNSIQKKNPPQMHPITIILDSDDRAYWIGESKCVLIREIGLFEWNEEECFCFLVIEYSTGWDTGQSKLSRNILIK